MWNPSKGLAWSQVFLFYMSAGSDTGNAQLGPGVSVVMSGWTTAGQHKEPEKNAPAPSTDVC